MNYELTPEVFISSRMWVFEVEYDQEESKSVLLPLSTENGNTVLDGPSGKSLSLLLYYWYCSLVSS